MANGIVQFLIVTCGKNNPMLVIVVLFAIFIGNYLQLADLYFLFNIFKGVFFFVANVTSLPRWSPDVEPENKDTGKNYPDISIQVLRIAGVFYFIV